jgi:DNA-binding FrmR family transcriptional regulator
MFESKGLVVQLDERVVGQVLYRLRRAQGQLAGLITMTENGWTARMWSLNWAAVSRAADRVGFEIVASGLRQLLAGDGDSL